MPGTSDPTAPAAVPKAAAFKNFLRFILDHGIKVCEGKQCSLRDGGSRTLQPKAIVKLIGNLISVQTTDHTIEEIGESRGKKRGVCVPLLVGDLEVPLDLQSVFLAAYEPSLYDRRLPYEEPLLPPLPQADEDWVRQRLLASRRSPARRCPAT